MATTYHIEDNQGNTHETKDKTNYVRVVTKNAKLKTISIQELLKTEKNFNEIYIEKVQETAYAGVPPTDHSIHYYIYGVDAYIEPRKSGRTQSEQQTRFAPKVCIRFT